jgi:hypothetical protein
MVFFGCFLGFYFQQSPYGETSTYLQLVKSHHQSNLSVGQQSKIKMGGLLALQEIISHSFVDTIDNITNAQVSCVAQACCNGVTQLAKNNTITVIEKAFEPRKDCVAEKEFGTCLNEDASNNCQSLYRHLRDNSDFVLKSHQRVAMVSLS